jgi:hypothetical protein
MAIQSIADVEKSRPSTRHEDDDISKASTIASRECGGEEEEGHEKEVDMGLQLTCSLRSGVGPRDLELEKPPDGGLRAWLVGGFPAVWGGGGWGLI